MLDFQYEAESSIHGLTSFAGLPLYFEIIKASGLAPAIRRHLRAAGGQGWLDIQMTLAVIFLNLSGGDCVEDGWSATAASRRSCARSRRICCRAPNGGR
jgi:hypothetical protein